MKDAVPDLLRNPGTFGTLKVDGNYLLDEKSGERFLIRDGIPVLVRDGDISGLNKKYKMMYDWLSICYDLMEKVADTFSRGGFNKFRKQLVDELSVRDGDRVLEVSVGTGTNLINITNKADFWGVDISFGMLKKCRSRLRRRGIKAELIQANAEALPFKENCFDIVLHFGGINFFNNKEKAVREMIRVAKPGAVILIGDETEKVPKQLPVIGKLFYERPGTKTYDAPLEFIPGEIQNVVLKRLWGDRLYIIRFQKP